jgi:hypothetical protein
MIPYIQNRNCQCTRCRAHGLMGAAVLITLGVLFLMNSYDVLRFEQGLPALLLVIGCVLLVSRTGSTQGHIQPGWTQPPVAQPIAQPPQPWPTTTTAVPPPPPPQEWTSGAENPPSSGQNDSQVKP